MENKQLSDVWNDFKNIITNTLSLRHAEDTNIQGTIEGIKKDIEFRGHTVWILILSIFIASIGLNQNSTAVVIGAMLISPLMGPILGIGLSLGTNDLKTLVKALKNFGVMVFIALLTSWIYFSVTPIVDVQQEIINRTQPNMLDAVIAFVGGLAGIIAGSRKEKTNVIPGVAIATALMPPLCTAGFGLAIGNFEYFFGAFYLFLLNSVFICLATVLIVKYLHFPLVAFLDKQREKRAKSMILFFTILIVAPSIYFFYGVSQQSLSKQKIENFIKEEFTFQNTNIFEKEFTFSDSLIKVDIFCIGEHIADSSIQEINQKLKNNDLQNVIFNFKQSPKDDKNWEEIIKSNASNNEKSNEIYIQQAKISEEQYSKIDSLQKALNTYLDKKKQFANISNEIKILFTEITKFGYAETIETNFEKEQSMHTFLIEWKTPEKKKRKVVHTDEETKMRNWLKNKLAVDTVRLIHYDERIVNRKK